MSLPLAQVHIDGTSAFVLILVNLVFWGIGIAGLYYLVRLAVRAELRRSKERP